MNLNFGQDSLDANDSGVMRAQPKDGADVIGLDRLAVGFLAPPDTHVGLPMIDPHPGVPIYESGHGKAVRAHPIIRALGLLTDIDLRRRRSHGMAFSDRSTESA